MKQSTITTLENAILDLDVNHLNNRFHKSRPQSILKWIVSKIPSNSIVQVSNFTIDDMVITDTLYKRLGLKARIPVIFIDTLHHHNQTLKFVEQARFNYNLDLQIYRPNGVNSREEFAAKYGKNLWEKDPEKFHYLTSVEPLEIALKQFKPKAIIDSVYPNYSEDEVIRNVFELDSLNRFKVNPIAYWNRPESWAYAYEYDLIYNPLYDQGYSLIGNNLN